MKGPMMRRTFITGMIAGGLTLAGTAFGGSYLNRAALLVAQAKREAAYLRKHASDTEVAHLIHRLCLGRVRAARDMLIPKEVKLAHPHLMLMLETYERAADAAAKRSGGEFVSFMKKAQDEELVFRSILEQLGWPLPDID